ncbi:MAG TPA: hypothetical protein VGI64_01940 [Streptosporangiaceae bacterium]|jgi:hypothetical protein
MSGKPTVESLGLDPQALIWQRSGPEHGGFELAFVPGRPGGQTEWVLIRLTGDDAGRILVYDRNEWECFLDGARHGEFDDAALPRSPAGR